MKKLKLFYNPFSGNKSFKFDLDVCIGIFQEGGYEVHPFRTLHPGDIDTHIATMDPNYDIIVASGGDGTVNIVLNAMMHRGLHIPLGIIPSGTANDFATYLGFKSGEVEDVCRTIVSTNPSLDPRSDLSLSGSSTPLAGYVLQSRAIHSLYPSINRQAGPERTLRIT